MIKKESVNVEDSISTKLKYIEEILDLTPLEMAKIGGCSQASYYRYRSGKSTPDWKFLINIIKYDSNVSSEWLLKNKGPAFLPTERGNRTTQESIILPFFEMMRINNEGEGVLTNEEWDQNKDTISICLDILNLTKITALKNLFAIRVWCDAMYPDVKPGSIAIIDKGQNNINLEGIFLIRMDDIIRMKLVQKVPGKKVQLSTINNRYPAIIIPSEDLADCIVGKFVWVGTPYM
jgi:phage repressor protein C with HTH and peptisase S24 domain/DNA-binding XRE family transcriptional regulator